MSSAEIPPAVRQAIEIAPVDPQYDGPQDRRVTLAVNGIIADWKTIKADQDNSFEVPYEKLMSQLETDQQKEAMNLYLAATAIGIAHSKPPPVGQTEQIVKKDERRAGSILIDELTNKNYKGQTEHEAYINTFSRLFNEDRIQSSTLLPDQPELKTEKREHPIEKLTALKREMAEALVPLMKQGKTPEMRDLLQMRKEMAIKHPDLAKYLFDLTIGDIYLRSESIENIDDGKYKHLPVSLGFEDPTLWRIMKRANEYEWLMGKADINYTGYQSVAMGWEGLIKKGIDYLNSFGMDGYVNNGTFHTFDQIKGEEKVYGQYLEYGGSGGMKRAYLLAKEVLEKENGIKDPGVLIPSPSFQMMKDVARHAGLKTHELFTSPEDNFIPTAEDIKNALDDPEKNIKIVVLTPINNPGSHVSETERVKGIMNMLKSDPKYKDVIVINDLAYLGTGDQELNRDLGETLNQWTRRIDVLAWTKLIGEPGLRLSTCATPDVDIARHLEAVTRGESLATSFATQFRGLGTLDFVKPQNIRELTELYAERQRRFIEVLKEHGNDIYDFQDHPESFWDAALYAFVPIKEKVRPLDVIIKTGLFGTPAAAFYGDKTDQRIPKYVRYALGVTPISDEMIENMKVMMNDVPNPDIDAMLAE